MIKKDSKVSYTIIDEDKVVSEEFTTHFRSVIAFGRAEIVEDEAERFLAFVALCSKFSGEQDMSVMLDIIKKYGAAVAIIKITVENITGKESKNYIETR